MIISVPLLLILTLVFISPTLIQVPPPAGGQGQGGYDGSSVEYFSSTYNKGTVTTMTPTMTMR